MKIGLVLTTTICVATGSCFLPSSLTLQLILEYAKWRSWDQVVIFDNLHPIDCVFSYARPLIECLSKEGISVSIQPAINPNIPDAIAIQRHRIGAVVFLDTMNFTSPENVLYLASQKLLYNYYVSWLMITSRNTDATIDTILRELNIGIDSDIVVATSSLTYSAFQSLSQTFKNRTCRSFRHYATNFDFHEPPERHVDENAMTNLNYAITENGTVFFYFIHVYKIRYADNASLVTHFLGNWSPESWLLKRPLSVKLRNDFKGLPIVFGLLNGTNDGQTDIIDEVEANDIAPLLDFANFVATSVNASIELVPHEKLGILNNKIWSNLLGDVVTGVVDIGLGYITINDERLAEMTFSHPLIRYMRNVYYHPSETGIMRDIFRQPFNNYLLGCVALTYIGILMAMGMIIYVAKTVLNNDEEKHVGMGEATLWCISIMCMQGSPWTPRNVSGKTVLLFSLIFALVTYNAYAGFITSILSVQASGIKSITDLLFHNFKLGYSITDDEYIRNVNDSHLRELYIRAFNSREARLDTTSGLAKAVKGHYGFFVSATLARRALRTTLVRERCTLRELPLPQTFTVVALPMANSCPYKKIINLNILRIRERGVLDRIAGRMLPEMPRCKSPTTFHSARLADVYSAFFLLIAGAVTAISIGIVERIWNKRKQMHESILRGIRQHHLMPHLPHLPHLPHFPHFPHLSHLPHFPHFSRFPHLPHFPHIHFHHGERHPADFPRETVSDLDTHDGNPMELTDFTNLEPTRENFTSDYEIRDGTMEGEKNLENTKVRNDRSRLRSRLSGHRRHSGLKRSSWASFSGLTRKNNRENDKNVDIANSNVFPFQH